MDALSAAEAAPRPSEPVEAPASESHAPPPMAEEVQPAVTMVTTGALTGSNPPADTETTDSSLATVLRPEEWMADSHPVSETGPETIEDYRRALAEAKESTAAAEEILNRFSREKITNELALLRKNRDAESRCRDLAANLKDREEEVLALRGSVQALEKRADDLGAALSAKSDECQALAAAKTAEVAALSCKAQALERRSGELVSQLAANSEEARAALRKKDGEAESLRADIQALEAKVAEMTAMAAAMAEDYRTALSRKEEEIQSLMTRISDREEQAYKLAVEIKGWEDRMRDVSEKEGQLKALYDVLELDLKKEIDTHQKLLDSLRRQLQAA